MTIGRYGATLKLNRDHKHDNLSRNLDWEKRVLDFRIRQLQCFLTLAEVLNYGKTARSLYISQPTLTFQIKGLEHALGVKLFERTRQHVRLTEAGAAFREYAKSILDTVDAARDCLQSLDSRLRLTIACGPVGQFVLLPNVIRMLADEYPSFELEVCEMTTEQQMAALPEGKVDALLMMPALPIEGIHFDPLRQEKMMAVVSSESQLAQQSAISVQVFRSTPIIASRLKDCRFHQPSLHSMLAPFGITPKFTESPQSCSVQFAYAAAGEGIAMTTEGIRTCVVPGVTMLPIEEELPPVTLGLAFLESNLSPAMKIFRKVVLMASRRLAATTRTSRLAPVVVKEFTARREMAV